jgi:predicted PurR-regulated permease PerM/phosphoglycolate phosphatase-like HAD superfamily hydrolase
MNTRWSPFVKQLVVVAGLLACVWLVFRVRVLLGPLVLALLLAYLASYPVNWAVRRTGWRRTPIVAVVLASTVLIIVAISVLIVPWSVGLLRSFSATLVSVVQELLKATPRPIQITPTLTIDLGTFYSPINGWLHSVIQPNLSTAQNLQRLFFPFASGAAVVVMGAVTSVLWIIFIFVISFYALKDTPRLVRLVTASIPPPWRPEAGKLWRELALIWDSFVRGRLSLSVLVGFLTGLAMSILGMRNAAALGLLAGILEFIPGIGPVIAAIPAVLIALILGSSWLPLPNGWFAILVILTYFLLSQFENNYLLPRVVGSRMALHPAAIIVGAVAGAELAGILGILLAAPVIASLRVLSAYAIRKLFDQDPFPAPKPRPSRAQLWEEQIRDRPARAILFDLDGTLIETDEGLVEQMSRRSRFFRPLLPDEQRAHLARRWLMASEAWINGGITVLDRLHLDGLLFGISDRLRRWQGLRTRAEFVTVDGSLETLWTLWRRGYPLALVTSRDHLDAEAFLAQYQLDSLFRAVISRDHARRLKPHPMPLQLAAKRLGVTPKQCVMVGDTSVDIRSAKAAGALAVGVLCGFGDRNDLAGADLVIDSPTELTNWL